MFVKFQKKVFHSVLRIVMADDTHVLQCYELLSLQYLEQSQDVQLWRRLRRWAQSTRHKNHKDNTLSLIVSLPKELWFIAVLLRENPERLVSFMVSAAKHSSLCAISISEDHEEEPLEVVSNYLQSFNFTELHLDTIFRAKETSYEELSVDDGVANTATATLNHHLQFRPPIAIFRCCPNVKVLSLKNNNLDTLPPDIGRLAKLERLYLTNNRLQNGSIPYTLAFCSSLKELYLDDNLLDALPSVLLRMPSLKTVHRHGNHNYFKSTFMW